MYLHIYFNVLLHDTIPFLEMFSVCMYSFIFRHLTQLSCNQIIAKTTRDLQHLNALARKGDKQQKLQVEKLTSDFKEALQCYSRLQQVCIYLT